MATDILNPLSIIFYTFGNQSTDIIEYSCNIEKETCDYFIESLCELKEWFTQFTDVCDKLVKYAIKHNCVEKFTDKLETLYNDDNIISQMSLHEQSVLRYYVRVIGVFRCAQ